MPAGTHRFSHAQEELRALASEVVARARRAGASAAECEVSEGDGLLVTVRKGEVEAIERNRDTALALTVYVGDRPHARRGHASSTDLSPAAIRWTVEAALAIAQRAAVDDCAGLPEPELLARAPRELDLYHAWELSVEEAIALGRRSEGAAFALSPRIKNSEGASVSAQHGQFALANSHGFVHGFASSRHSLSLAVIAEEGGRMQRDDWLSEARVPDRLASPEALGRYAGERALARLGARRMRTARVPVLFEAPVAASLLASFVAAASGANLYRRASFLADALGTQVFARGVWIEERPFEPQGLASSPYDAEGVAAQERVVVRDGVLEGYFLGCYSARKLGLRSTGNAGGNHNLVLRPNGPDLPGMLQRLHRGLFVTELLGHGVNLVTGDFSRGAAGYWVEGGEIVHPVEEVTVAGNLRDMFRAIVAVGSDVVVRGSRRCGSVLIESMTVAGA